VYRIRLTRKGISNTVTALILVIAAVIITLMVVGYSFGLFGAFAGTPTVTQVGTGIAFSDNGYVILKLHSTGNVKVVSAQIAGTTYTNNTVSIVTYTTSSTTITINSPFLTENIKETIVGYIPIGSSLSAGINTVAVQFYGFTPQPGETYTVVLSLSDGQTVVASVTAQ